MDDSRLPPDSGTRIFLDAVVERPKALNAEIDRLTAEVALLRERDESMNDAYCRAREHYGVTYVFDDFQGPPDMLLQLARFHKETLDQLVLVRAGLEALLQGEAASFLYRQGITAESGRVINQTLAFLFEKVKPVGA